MKANIVGDSDCPMLNVTLNLRERIKVERGSMVYMQNVELEGKLNTNSGLLGALGRSMTSGESMFISTATGKSNDAMVGIAPPTAGEIKILKIDSQHQYRLNTGAFLASDDTVSYYMKRQKLGAAFFGGTGGLYVAETSGAGDLVVSAYGSLIELKVTPDNPITIDNEHVVIWDASLDYSIGIASGMFGFKTGEGIVNRFRGNGSVWVQTRNIASLAGALLPFFPPSGN